MPNIQIINPIEYPGWDDLVISSPDYSFFHSSNWARVLHESYKYEPLYFTLMEGEKIVASLPFMDVKSFVTGRRGVSLPFSDYCDSIVFEQGNSTDLFEHVIQYGKRVRWRCVEFRGETFFSQELQPSSYYYGHVLKLSESEEKIFSGFRSSTKRNIRKAIREGVCIDISNSFESLREFYRLHCVTRKRHGIPPQPYQFFKKIYEHVISKNLGMVVLASYKEKRIAGAVCCHFGDKAIYKFGASDMDYQHLRANNAVIWEAIKWYCENGNTIFSLGRTQPDNKGLLQFKDGWGCEKRVIKYYEFDLRREIILRSRVWNSGVKYSILSRFPVPLLRIIGEILYKHMG